MSEAERWADDLLAKENDIFNEVCKRYERTDPLDELLEQIQYMRSSMDMEGDYYTGYMCALSYVEGAIARIKGCTWQSR